MAVCFSLAAAAGAQIDLTKSGADKTPINLSALTAAGGQGAVFKRTLENDLKLSGWFLVTDRGGVSIEGTCSEGGSRLSARLRVASQAAGRSFLDRSYEGGAQEARRLAHNAADDIVKAVRGKQGIASTTIIMIGTRGGKKDIYVCDADGGNLRQLTHDGAVCASPNWLPDPRGFTYTSYYEKQPYVYLVDLMTGSRRRFSQYPGLNAGAVMAPDGSRAVLTLSMHGNPELYILNSAGGNPRRLTRTQSATEASPAWSPDGRQIVFVSDRAGTPQLYVMDSGGGADKRITYVGSQNVAPDWAADGKIAWTSRRGGRYEICYMDTLGGKEQQVPGDGSDWEDPSWAPDGRHIVCSRTTGYHSDIYIIDIMGDPPIRLTTVAGEWYSPDWSSK